MISIIICSRTKTINSILSENINNTIGCDYELIVIDNSANKYSIFEAYNIGIEKSTNNYLCFIHDDIIFHSKDWGNTINNLFRNEPQIGLIGIAGSKFKTKIPSTWWNCPQELKSINIIQHFSNGEIIHQKFGFKNNSMQEVVTIDGVFMVLRKDLNIIFNSEMNGFHNYDLNLSFECVKKGYKIIVTDEILIEHFSTGTINEAWVDSVFEIHNLYKNILPLSIPANKTNEKFEVANAIRYINRCLKFNRNTKAFFIWKILVFKHPYSRFHFTFLRGIVKNKLRSSN